MSSVLRVHSQIPVRAKYLIVDISAGIGATPSTGEAFTIDDGKALPADNRSVIENSVLDVVSGTSKIASAAALSLGQLYRDLGRLVVVVNAYGEHLAHFRAAQLVSGPLSEGVPADYIPDIYICVWSANGLQVSVSRTG